MSNETSKCLLFLSKYAVGIFTRLSKRNTINLLFDSHCTNSCGITDSLFGFSVLSLRTPMSESTSGNRKQFKNDKKCF